MPDAMVTARMDAQRKDAGSRALAELGVSASEAINLLYEYVIKKGRLPFDRNSDDLASREQRLAESIAKVDSIPKFELDERFGRMTMAEIRLERARRHALVDDDSPYEPNVGGSHD
ncbi:MAG: type II toxin-antitoxin system RelB/DinJ family antitoxin [Olsenella sp.]|nr:type II toxin-antitoxin system RelB/DinJ family antitoxin [Olsenella sp.]